MAITADKSNITTRAEKTSPLTYNEMDNNWLELERVIDDAGANDSAIASLSSSLTSIDDRVTTLEGLQNDYMTKAANLSDLVDVVLARSNLGVYSKTETDDRYLNEASNLSDVSDPAASRSNLGIGDIATRDIFISTADPTAGNGDDGDIWLTYE